MITVDQMIDDIIRREGGYVDHPKDRGGPTKYGITLATLSAWLGRQASVEGVKRLDEITAREIYRANYFVKPRIDKLPPALQPFLFDCAVNHGPSRAVKFLQRACAVKEDGVIGPETIAKASAADPAWLRVELIDMRRQFYLAIVDRDPSQKVFLKGWLNRLAEFESKEEPAMRDDSQLVEAMCQHVYEQAMRRVWAAQGVPETAQLTTWNVLDAQAQMEWRLQMQDALAAIAKFERKEGPDPAAQIDILMWSERAEKAEVRIAELEAALRQALGEFDRAEPRHIIRNGLASALGVADRWGDDE